MAVMESNQLKAFAVFVPARLASGVGAKVLVHVVASQATKASPSQQMRFSRRRVDFLGQERVWVESRMLPLQPEAFVSCVELENWREEEFSRYWESNNRARTLRSVNLHMLMMGEVMLPQPTL